MVFGVSRASDAVRALLLETRMELRDGFIVGVFNYCDSWCDSCPFTSRCRVFADIAETEASRDPNLKPVVDAPPIAKEVPPPPPAWLQELLDEANAVAAPGIPESFFERRGARLTPEHLAIDHRAEGYSRRARQWLAAGVPDSGEAGDPRAVIGWFHMLIHVKAMRALHGQVEADPSDRDWPADHDGSAKVALIGIDRSHNAWLDLVDGGFASPEEAFPFIEDLSWLRDALERMFPKARAFVRPGFDEPDEVARLRDSLE